CNPDEYLIDETGNRRFWPVATSKINLNALSQDRDQLWAEAAMAEATGETLVMDAELWAEAAALVDARMPDEPWQDVLAAVENMPNAAGSLERTDAEIRVTSEFLLEGVLRFDRSRVRRNDTKRLAGVMKRLGWKKPKNLRIGTKVAKGYVKKIAR